MSLTSGVNFYHSPSENKARSNIIGNLVVLGTHDQVDLQSGGGGINITEPLVHSNNLPCDPTNVVTDCIGLDSAGKWIKTAKDTPAENHGDIFTDQNNEYDTGVTNTFKGDVIFPNETGYAMLELDADKKVRSVLDFHSGNLARINWAHAISGAWTFSGTNTHSGPESFTNFTAGSSDAGVTTVPSVKLGVLDSTHQSDAYAGIKLRDNINGGGAGMLSCDAAGEVVAGNTFSGAMEHLGDNTFGNDSGSGGVGRSIHYGQVYFHDSSTSGDAAVPGETLCRTADNKLKHYDPDAVSHAWTGTNSYPSLTASSMLELNGSGNVVSTSGFSSGNLARINADHTISGAWTFSGTTKMSALTASTGLALDSNKNIISGSSGVGLGDTNNWTAENNFADETAFADTSTYTADLIMETGNMDMEQGDIDVQVGTLMVSSGLVNIAAVTAPTSASASGTAGQVAFDANYMYRCTATNTWKRVAIASW